MFLSCINSFNSSLVGKEFASINDDNYSYRYFTFDELKDVLLSSNYIGVQFNIIPEIVDIICQYHGNIDWSKTDKSENISIVNSTDGNISYAVVERKRNGQDTILFNEWIDLTDIFESESKQDSGGDNNSVDNSNNDGNNNVLRYVFKFIEYRDKKRYQNNGENDGVAQIRLGFITPQFNTVFADDSGDNMIGLPFEREIEIMKDTIDSTADDEYIRSQLEMKYSYYSMSWHTNGAEGYFVDTQHDFRCNINNNNNKNNGGINNPKWFDETCTTDWNYFDVGFQTGYKNKDSNSYIMIQVDLNNKTMMIISDGLQDQENEKQKFMIRKIRKELVQEMKKTKQIRFGVSLHMTRAGRFAIGLVRI